MFHTAIAVADDEPWADGVAQTERDQATALFDQGNNDFAQKAYASAVESYRAALAHWDHPLIRFNLAVGLLRLDRPLEASPELTRALQFGSQPFTDELYRQALDYQALLKRLVGRVVVRCEQRGVEVSLDGKPWFRCPGTHEREVLVGAHTLVGELANHLTASHRVDVQGDRTSTQELRLVSIESTVRFEYRYRRWVPFAVAGGGLVLGIGGALAWNQGDNFTQEHAREFARLCPIGCMPDELPRADRDELDAKAASARLWNRLGIGLVIAASATLATGIVMVVRNRPRRTAPTLGVTAGGMGATATWRF